MSKGIMDKVLGFMGFEEEEIDVFEEEIPREFEEPQYKKKKGNIFSLHAQKQMKVVVMEPTAFEDVLAIADNLKNRRPVIINLECTEKELARRVVDFISGATYALSGNMQKIGHDIFLFVPSGIDIASELKDQEKEKGLFTWVK